MARRVALRCRQVLQLRAQLTDEVVPIQANFRVHGCECVAYTAFCGDMLLHGKKARLTRLHAVQVSSRGCAPCLPCVPDVWPACAK